MKVDLFRQSRYYTKKLAVVIEVVITTLSQLENSLKSSEVIFHVWEVLCQLFNGKLAK